ncbi:tyrosine-type recombinase/integrase [Mesorhizobium sp. NBSH29]|uniref:tyrosine-type recombinase/integrase n=1 Tax=Mesorhizobium sp. NBSH29 TaxID=2654249 RepID=UPI0035BBAEE4
MFIRKETRDSVYSYDFQFRGRRFSGSTGKTSKREAQLVEKLRREEAKAAFDEERAAFSPEITIEAAAARYWEEVGQHHRNAATTLWSLEWLIAHFGRTTMMHDISESKIASMVAKRRGELVPSRRKPGRIYSTPEIRKRISPATVNRTVTQPLREIMIRAGKTWGSKVQAVRWADHLLKEPQERVREARPDEEGAIMHRLERGYDVAVEFAFITGCRRMEIVGLEWSRVDFFGRQITVLGKGGRSRVIPMTKALFELLWAQQGHHATRVFTYVAKRTVKHSGRELHRGKRYAVTDSGLKSAMRRAIDNANVQNFRFHDTRHTAATRVLRKSNLRVVQELLGHQDIATTTKYAHAMKEDVRDAMESAAMPVAHPALAKGRNVS